VVATSAISLLICLALAADRVPLAGLGVALTALALVAALPVAILPISTAERYRRRAHSTILTDPEQALRDLTQALELDPQNRAVLIDRARVLRLLGQHTRAAHDLRAYLNRPVGEPRARVLRARLLLQHIEAGSVTAPTPGPPRVGVGT